MRAANYYSVSLREWSMFSLMCLVVISEFYLSSWMCLLSVFEWPFSSWNETCSQCECCLSALLSLDLLLLVLSDLCPHKYVFVVFVWVISVLINVSCCIYWVLSVLNSVSFCLWLNYVLINVSLYLYLSDLCLHLYVLLSVWVSAFLINVSLVVFVWIISALMNMFLLSLFEWYLSSVMWLVVFVSSKMSVCLCFNYLCPH